MIYYIKFLLFFLTFVMFWGCSKWGANEDRFVNAYRDVITIRMIYTDTAKANPRVVKILARYGYTKESFKQDFFHYSADHDLFRAMIDSAQIRAKRDYNRINKNLPRYAE